MTSSARLVKRPPAVASGPVAVVASRHTRLRPLQLGDVEITGGLWADRQRLNRETLIPGAAAHLEAAGNFENLRAAAGRGSGPFRGPVFMDSDVYKWLEAIGWELSRGSDGDLADLADRAITLVADAQQEDGYLNSYYQVARPGERWTNLAQDHELYCAGHLIQAGIAQARGRGDERLLSVARRFADLIHDVFPGSGRKGTPGHPEVEMAMVELYRETGETRYLNLAEYFIEQRGHELLGPGHYGSSYYQDHAPVRESTTITGHAVRALYLAAGVTDVYLETGDRELLAVMEDQWRDMTSAKTYITGGLGAHHQDEAFGDPFELPPDRCYGETCAAIASIMWNWRMLLATGDGRYADLLERTLYNGFLAGLALDGSGFSYVNPLQVRSEHRDPVERGARRQPWYDVACCPPNAMRLLASLQHYIATVREADLQIHQYMPARLGVDAADGGRLEVEMSTEYPWGDSVRLRIAQTPADPWSLSLRTPAWATDASVFVAGERQEVEPAAGYMRIRRAWQPGEIVELELPMRPRLVAPHPRIDAVRGCVAIERGPLVYCVEQADQPSGVAVDDVGIDSSEPLRTQTAEELFPGAMAVIARGFALRPSRWSETWAYAGHGSADSRCDLERTELIAIPYAFWGNRTEGPMRVWIPMRT